MEDSAPRITAAEALRLVAPYFLHEWTDTPVEKTAIERVMGGFMHSLHLITRSTAAVNEPNCVLIRHFGMTGTMGDPTESSTGLIAAEQAVVYYEMARRGWGPNVYGFFRGGRLEEYLDAHPLTAAEAATPVISTDIARSYARLHSLDLPLRKRNYGMLLAEFKQSLPKLNTMVEKLRLLKYDIATDYANALHKMDWAAELDFVSEAFRKHSCRLAPVVGDSNYLNLLVKNYESDCRVLLIDYETVAYTYRGVDLGGHFNERMYQWAHPETKMTGYDAPVEEEQRQFCAAYLKETHSLGLHPSDTVDQLIVEATVGRMYHILFSNLMCGAYDEFPDDSVMFLGMIHMMETYYKVKREYLSRYGSQ